MSDARGSNRITVFTKLSYGVGQSAEAVKNNAFELFLFFYYNQVLGLPGTLTGLAIFIALCVDALTDPLIASLSDNCRSRWGRRHPWMYVSAIPLAAAFVQVFSPPSELSQSGLFVWLTLFAILVRLSMTLYQVPHLALGAELSDDYEERTAIVGYRTAFGLIGGGGLVIIAFSVFFKATPDFPNGQLNPEVYPGFGLLFALVMWLTIWWSAVGTHHCIPHLRNTKPYGGPFRVKRVVRELKSVFKTQPFRVLFLSMIFFFIMRGVQNTLSLHTTTFFWELTPPQIQSVTLALMVGLIIGIPFSKPLSRWLDKKWLFLISIAWALLFHVGPVILRLFGWLPENGDPALIHFLIIASILGGMGAVQALIAGGSMIADISDIHEFSTGQRQEGMFFGGLAFAGKAASGLGHSIAGVAMDMIQFPTDAEPGAVASEMLRDLALIYGPGVGVIGLIALIIFSRYTVTRARIIKIQTALGRSQ